MSTCTNTHSSSTSRLAAPATHTSLIHLHLSNTRLKIMPTYTNTHSSGSACGIQTTYFFREARALIKEELHGTSDDVVLFSGM